MSAAKRVRWECPHGLHPGELGSTRPRKDATVRFCLPCSIDDGRLVERVAPALERQRAARTATVQARAAARKQREREREAARFVVQALRADGVLVDVDVWAEMFSCCRQLRITMPELTVRFLRYGTRGRAFPDHYPNGRVIISTSGGDSYENLVEIILHEAVHLAVGGKQRSGSTKREWHGRAFKRRLLNASMVRWPQIDPLVDGNPEVEAAITARVAYDLDELIVHALKVTTPGSVTGGAEPSEEEETAMRD